MKVVLNIKKKLIKIDFIKKIWIEYNDLRSYLKNKKYTSQKGIARYKNTKKGKRCFIIGNGPSLKISDLEKLIGEDTFAVNRIYKIFDQTNWRPTFYCSQDIKVLDEVKYDMNILTENCQGIFLNSYICKNNKKMFEQKPKLSFFYLDDREFYPSMPKFSRNVSKKVYEGYTVAYACIQLAVYMGYSYIYIIGTDHNYNVNLLQNGEVKEEKCVSNYMKGLEGKLCFYPQLEKSTLAFTSARHFCDNNNIVIKNATRGGKLEEFERVEFETLFD